VGDVLAIDLGTTGVKVAVVGDDGCVRAVASESHSLRLLPGGGAEQDPNAWWQAIGRCSRQVVERASDITVIAVTSQYMSLVAVDVNGLPLSPCMMWMDQRGAPLHPSLGNWDQMPVCLDRHGLPPLPNDNIAHMAWLMSAQPELIDAIFVEPADALTARLTARVTATQTTALGMLATDNRTWGATAYSDELLAISGIDRTRLPTLIPAGSTVGTVTAAAAAHLGINPRAIVLTGSIDTITSAVGTGAVAPDRCGLIIGTTSVLVTHVGDKRGDLEHGIPTLPSLLADLWFVMAENGVGGKALERAAALTGFSDIATALAAATSAPVGCNGAMFAPWLVGSMAPGNNDDVRGGWLGIGLGTERSDLIRAVVEGVALNAAWLFAPFQTLTGHRPDDVVFGGGGAASSLWAQTLADCLGVPTRRLAQPGSTNARGAAMLARIHLGEMSLDDVESRLDILDTFDPNPTVVGQMAEMTESLVGLHTHLAAWHTRR
jgi:xylulokinase